MKTLVIGQRIPIKDLTSAHQITLEVVWQAGTPGGLKHHLILKNDPGGPVPADAAYTLAGPQGKHEIQIPQLPPGLRIAVVVEYAQGLKTLPEGQLIFRAQGQVVAQLPFSGRNFTTEKTGILAEIYFKNEWRVAALCQGFGDLLPGALRIYGGALAPIRTPPPPPAPSPLPSSTGKLNLSKLTLEKQGASGTIELSKSSPLHPININLKWSGQVRSGLSNWFGLKPSTPDLDLGCMVEMQNGDSLVIQALGGYFGSRHAHPYILLDKDDRSGTSQDGENLTIFKPSEVRRMLVYAFIYDGAATFADVQARVTLTDQQGNEIVIPLNQNRDERFCALALIQKEGANIRITKEERYFQGHRPCDEHYRFGFSWTTGRKD